MSVWRYIAVSSLLHAAILGHAFAAGEPTDELQSESALSENFVELSRLEYGVQTEDEGTDRPGGSLNTDLKSMDLRAGLDGNSETRPEPLREENSRKETAEEQRERSDASDREEPASEKTEPSNPNRGAPSDAVAASEESESEHEATEEPSEAAELRESASTAGESEAEESESPEGESSEGAEAAETVAGGTPGGTGDSGGPSGEGSGEGGGGRGEGAGAGRGDGIDRGALIRAYTRELHRTLAENKYYPRAAKRAGLEGTVRIEVTIDTEGHILAVQLHESSGHDILDSAAMKMMNSVEKFPPPPEALAWQEKRLRVPIPYRLDSAG